MKIKTFIAPSAVVTGEVRLENNVNIWHGAVLRGDSGRIFVGENTNIQEHCILHEETSVGKNCTVGHGAILHGCTIGNNCLVGMGAIVLNGAVIRDNCMIGAGALVTGKMNAPAGSLILGNPATVVKPLTQEQIDYIAYDAKHYVELAKEAFE